MKVLAPRYGLLAMFGVCATALAAAAQDQATGRTPTTLNPLSLINPSSLDAFRDRPLFSASRRPPNVAVAAEAVVTIDQKAPELRLIGVTQTSTGAVASITDLKSGAKLSLRLGEAFRDWKVTSIEPSSLILRRAEETSHFSIFKEISARSGLPKQVESTPPEKGMGAERQNPGTNETQDLIDVFGTGSRSLQQ